MAVRTTDFRVRAVIDTDAGISVNPFIVDASVLVDRLSTLAGTDLTAAELAAIETYIAAHLYSFKDPQYESKSTDKASAKFQGKTDMGLDSTYWGQFAKRLDHTGILAQLDKEDGSPNIELIWGGTA